MIYVYTSLCKYIYLYIYIYIFIYMCIYTHDVEHFDPSMPNISNPIEPYWSLRNPFRSLRNPWGSWLHFCWLERNSSSYTRPDAMRVIHECIHMYAYVCILYVYWRKLYRNDENVAKLLIAMFLILCITISDFLQTTNLVFVTFYRSRQVLRSKLIT